MAILRTPVKRILPRSIYSRSSVPAQAILRALKQPLYDTEVHPQAGTNTITFFLRPQGQSLTYAGGTVTKSEWHTSMRQSSQIGTPNEFDLYGFSVELETGAYKTSHINIYKWGVFKFFFGSNSWLTIPLTKIPQGTAVDGILSGTTDVAYLRQGTPSPNVFYNFTIGRTGKKILGTEQFHAEITFPAGTTTSYADTYVRVFMIGVFHGQL